MNIVSVIQELLDSDISAYRIAKEAGVAQPVITRLRNGKRPISTIEVQTAQKLIDFWVSQKD